MIFTVFMHTDLMNMLPQFTVYSFEALTDFELVEHLAADHLVGRTNNPFVQFDRSVIGYTGSGQITDDNCIRLRFESFSLDERSIQIKNERTYPVIKC